MDKLQGFVSINDYRYAKIILEKSLLIYKKLSLFEIRCANKISRENIYNFKKSIMEQFSQLIVILEVQDENQKDDKTSI